MECTHPVVSLSVTALIEPTMRAQPVTDLDLEADLLVQAHG
jgi:hypothetical protein